MYGEKRGLTPRVQAWGMLVYLTNPQARRSSNRTDSPSLDSSPSSVSWLMRVTPSTPREELGIGRHIENQDDWNRDYPNEPKSIWWFVNARWVGLRVVREVSSE